MLDYFITTFCGIAALLVLHKSLEGNAMARENIIGPRESTSILPALIALSMLVLFSCMVFIIFLLSGLTYLKIIIPENFFIPMTNTGAANDFKVTIINFHIPAGCLLLALVSVIKYIKGKHGIKPDPPENHWEIIFDYVLFFSTYISLTATGIASMYYFEMKLDAFVITLISIISCFFSPVIHLILTYIRRIFREEILEYPVFGGTTFNNLMMAHIHGAKATAIAYHTVTITTIIILILVGIGTSSANNYEASISGALLVAGKFLLYLVIAVIIVASIIVGTEGSILALFLIVLSLLLIPAAIVLLISFALFALLMLIIMPNRLTGAISSILTRAYIFLNHKRLLCVTRECLQYSSPYASHYSGGTRKCEHCDGIFENQISDHTVVTLVYGDVTGLISPEKPRVILHNPDLSGRNSAMDAGEVHISAGTCDPSHVTHAITYLLNLPDYESIRVYLYGKSEKLPVNLLNALKNNFPILAIKEERKSVSL